MKKIRPYLLSALIGFFPIAHLYCFSVEKDCLLEQESVSTFGWDFPDSTMTTCNDLQIKMISPQIRYDANTWERSFHIITENDSIVFTTDDIFDDCLMTVFRKSKSGSTDQVLIEQKECSDLNIDFRESEYYIVNNHTYIIVSHPMGWTGLMTNYSFYQLISLEEKTVDEFISFGDNPCVLREGENGFEIIRKEGVYNPESGMWEITEIVDGKLGENAAMTYQEMILFLEDFKESLIQAKTEQLADLVLFPLHGDCFWVMAYTEEELKEFEQLGKEQFEREDFIERYARLFNEAFVSLIKNIEFEKIEFEKTFDEVYRVSFQMAEYADTNLDIVCEINDNQIMGYAYISLNTEGEFEHSVMYFFRKINGKVKLYSIRCAG